MDDATFEFKMNFGSACIKMAASARDGEDVVLSSGEVKAVIKALQVLNSTPGE